MRTLVFGEMLALLLAGCGGKPAEPPLVTLTPALEQQLTALGAECTDLKRIGGEPDAAPNVLQCKSVAVYASVNTYEHGEIQSIELVLSGKPADLRARYGALLEPIAGKDVVAAIRARIPDGGIPIGNPEMSKVGGIGVMLSSATADAGWRYDVTLTWR